MGERSLDPSFSLKAFSSNQCLADKTVLLFFGRTVSGRQAPRLTGKSKWLGNLSITDHWQLLLEVACGCGSNNCCLSWSFYILFRVLSGCVSSCLNIFGGVFPLLFLTTESCMKFTVDVVGSTERGVGRVTRPVLLQCYTVLQCTAVLQLGVLLPAQLPVLHDQSEPAQ